MKLAWSRLLVAACAAALASLPVARAQAPATPGVASAQAQPATFKKEEIEQLVAPIALYPDALIAQILMAATYPLEVIHAARWSKANPKVKDKALLALDRRAGSRRCSGDAARGEAPPLLRSRLNSKEGSQWTL